MKIYTSYFYNIRNMPRWVIPLSTARSDPPFYHDRQGKNHWYIDKRGVINGLRADIFAPGSQLEGLCDGSCSEFNEKCRFLLGYKEQLNKLNFEDIMRRIENICQKAKDYMRFEEEPEAAFIVWEAPNNPCSERLAIQQWFVVHGVQVEEYPIPPKRSHKPERYFYF